MKNILSKISTFLDHVSNFLAPRKGFIPLLGITLIVLNFILQFLAPGWIIESNLLLHLGIILAIFGIMISWAL